MSCKCGIEILNTHAMNVMPRNQFTKKTPCPAGKSVKLLKEQERDWKRVSPAQAALDKRSSHPLFSIPGVSTALVIGDSLHILYSRGVASHLAGSLLAYVCYFDWPHRQQVPPNTRLQALFSRIKELYPVGVTKMTNLRLSMVVDTQRPHKSYPCLESKASECKHLLPCVEIVMKEVLIRKRTLSIQRCLAASPV